MYNYDWEYLVHLLYSFVSDTQPEEKPENISFKNVFEIGKIHEVANIAFLSVEKLNKKPDDALYNEWKIYYYFSVERDAKQAFLYEKATALLHENGIRTTEAQGTVTKTLYPSPDLRMMSDIDLIIDSKNIPRAYSLFEDAGYKVIKQKENEFDAYSGNYEIEIHSEFFTKTMYNREEKYSSAISLPFEHSVISPVNSNKYILSDDYYYLFSLLHTVKHFETAGCGIRRVLDIYYLRKAYENKCDLSFINRVIDENGFRKSVDTLFALEEKWFEGKESGIDLSEAENDIIKSGNHGVLDLYTRNTIRKEKSEGVKFARLKKIIGFVFPNKEYVYLAYPKAKEKGYGTVRCWFVRAGLTLKRFDFSHMINYIRNVIKSK